jgi:hypothetical protein
MRRPWRGLSPGAAPADQVASPTRLHASFCQRRADEGESEARPLGAAPEYRSLPLPTLFDENMNEVARLIEPPPTVSTREGEE